MTVIQKIADSSYAAMCFTSTGKLVVPMLFEAAIKAAQARDFDALATVAHAVIALEDAGRTQRHLVWSMGNIEERILSTEPEAAKRCAAMTRQADRLVSKKTKNTDTVKVIQAKAMRQAKKRATKRAKTTKKTVRS